MAKGQGLRALKEQARDRRLRAIDPEKLHGMQRAAMYHRHWTTALGTIAYAGELPPELGIPFVNVLDAETDRLWLKAHENAGSAGADEGSSTKREVRRTTLAAQAFVRMMENGGGKGKANRADLVIVCDLEAYRRATPTTANPATS